MIFIKEFLNNPAGKGSSVLNINATKSEYIKRYDTIAKSITHQIFFVKKDIYFLINIPSSVNGIMYDIVIKFSPTSTSTGATITDMSMQIFSNSPSFLYTYANAYNKQKVFAKEFKKKLSSKMITDIAKTKNPYGVLSYDFSVFCALYYIVNNDYLKIDVISNYAKKASVSDVVKLVKDAELLQKNRSIQKNYNKILAEQELSNKKNKIKYSSKKSDDIEEPDIVKDVKDTKKVKSVKKSKQTKRTKKI